MGKGGYKAGFIEGEVQFACVPHDRPEIHDEGKEDAGERADYEEKDAAFFKGSGEIAGDQADHAPGQHLKGCPRALTEIEVGEERGESADQKAGFRAQIDGGNDS